MMEQMSEKELSRNIVKEAKDLNWLVYHTWLSKFSPAGFPDLCMVRGNRLLFWELKTNKGKVNPLQEAWIDALSQVPGVEAKIVRPDNLEEAYKELI
jgi:hypothetical protein